jgi:hypothetical protein
MTTDHLQIYGDNSESVGIALESMNMGLQTAVMATQRRTVNSE